MVFAHWSKRSLRSWLWLGMVLTTLPLAASAALNHWLLRAGVIARFDDVSSRYRDEIEPLAFIQIGLWEAAVPAERFLESPDPLQPAEYRRLRLEIESRFTTLKKSLSTEPHVLELLARAETDWTAADGMATRLFARTRAPGDAEGLHLFEEFVALTAAAQDKLGAVSEGVTRDIRADHEGALLAFERADWISGIAIALSLLCMVAGINIIAWIMLANVDRLVHGAREFAAGARDHRVEIQLPPEFREVADEFNRMIARIHEAEEMLADQARRDVMTGLLNRRSFDEAMDQAISRLARFGDPVALLIMDVDHFKRINDNFGHSVGDDVLRTVAGALRTAVRDVDSLFRIGGEEFAVLLYGTEAQGAMRAAERLRLEVAARRVACGADEISMTVSVGVAIAEPSASGADLVRAADQALYAAKSAGRNRVAFADGTTAPLGAADATPLDPSPASGLP